MIREGKERIGDVDVTGEVLEADIRRQCFHVWLDDDTGVKVTFPPQEEAKVTTALRNHRDLRLQVIGRGRFSPQGKLLHVMEVEKLRLWPVREARPRPEGRPIEEVIAGLAAEVPDADWERLPADLTDHLDHYLYGTPKR